MSAKPFVSNVAFLLVLATCCAGVFWLVLHSKEVQLVSSSSASTLAGRQTPAFRFSSLSGRPFDSARLQKPTVLEVFAAWCEICAAEIPSLNRLHSSFPNIDVVAVTGSEMGSDMKTESKRDLLKYRTVRKVSYDIAFQPSLSAAKAFNVTGYPSIYVMDKSGRIVMNASGAVSYSTLQSAVQDAIK